MDSNIIRQMDFDSIDPDEQFICPYDPYHKIIAKRFPYHLMKCRKNWNGRTMLTCIFNARHVVPASEHRHHIVNCPDKKCIEEDHAFEQRTAGLHQGGGNNVKGCTALPTYNRLPSPTEDWDSECAADNNAGYNPDDYPQPPAFQNLAGYSAGEKREYHQGIGAVHFKKQENLDAHPPKRFTTDSAEQGTLYQPHARKPNSTADTDTHQPQPRRANNSSDTNAYQPRGNQANSALHQPYAQAKSTASGSGELLSVRLPKQPAKAAGMTTGASGSQRSSQSRTKTGGRIAANIFTGDDSNGQEPSGAAFMPQPIMSTPLAASENFGGQGSSAFQRPAVGIGRGIAPGLGRGFVPGIGRGLKINNTSAQK